MRRDRRLTSCPRVRFGDAALRVHDNPRLPHSRTWTIPDARAAPAATSIPTNHALEHKRRRQEQLGLEAAVIRDSKPIDQARAGQQDCTMSPHLAAAALYHVAAQSFYLNPAAPPTTAPRRGSRSTTRAPARKSSRRRPPPSASHRGIRPSSPPRCQARGKSPGRNPFIECTAMSPVLFQSHFECPDEQALTARWLPGFGSLNAVALSHGYGPSNLSVPHVPGAAAPATCSACQAPAGSASRDPSACPRNPSFGMLSWPKTARTVSG